MQKSFKISTPGRICLFGEHQDYLNLPVIACAISLRIAITGSRRKDLTINLDLPDIGERNSFSIASDIAYTEDKDYFKSVVNVLLRKGLTFSAGFDCTVKGDIPINAGTSSSSALVVTWVNFLAQMSDQAVQLSEEEIAEFAYQAEVLEFSQAGGMMDQYSTALGGTIFLDSRPKIDIERLPADLKTFVLGDSEEAKDTQEILGRVKERVFEIVRRLKKKRPGFSLGGIRREDVYEFAEDLSPEQLELLHGTVRNYEITLDAKEILLQTSLNHNRLGSLLNQHQSILRDVLKISTPKIDRMIAAALEAGAYGAKINGSGGGGCMFAYAPHNSQQVLQAIERAGGKSWLVNVDEGTRIG
ncbi:MAG: GHMP kinase [Caldithrix sp.]|nr:MAG: GHMP kinase [Caldithrix sp.]